MASRFGAYLSKRGERFIQVIKANPVHMNQMGKAMRNPYHPTENPQGLVNLSTAQNTCLAPIIVEKLNQREFLQWEPWMLPYTERPCLWRLRKAVASFLTEETGAKTPLDPNNVMIVNRVTAIMYIVAYLLSDEGDTFLSPTPMYGAIPRDFEALSNVTVYPVPLSSEPGPNGGDAYELTDEMLEAALNEAKQKGHKVTGLFLVNPQNPLGIVYTKEQVLTYMNFCKRHEIHCILDEIYLCCIYDQSVPNSSVLGFDLEEIPDIQRTHVMWGFSKDFGMPGSPISAFYSWNKDLVQATCNLASTFFGMPTYNQFAASKLLEDREWLRNVCIPTNLSSLGEHLDITIATLDELGVPYLKPTAGLFIWADFGKFLAEKTLAEEVRLAEAFEGHGVALPPASTFLYDDPGFFRIIFAVPKHELLEGLKRMKEVCLSFSKPSGTA
ncbi:1-aminocyclopropane-1-carboxylate synthase-like protein 1 isoform X1 [Diadema antillarum]|uniref:1-aminocyclopropane-1-carboxylate synthase-like protein 1 isoform X1 n=2 Tax=Diadema antillarum TaxID=105358 RepID=UPI003A85A67B